MNVLFGGGKRLWAFGKVTASKALELLASHATFAIACAALIGAGLLQLTRPVDDALGAWRAQVLQRGTTGAVVVVELDTRSLRAIGEWPWRREVFARAVENLRHAGAEMVAFDVDFSARSRPGDDEALRRAFAGYQGSVVLPSFVQRSGVEENSPLASLSADALVASVNVPIDADGRTRRYNRGFERGGQYRASMASVLAGEHYGATGQFLIDYGIRARDIERLSFIDVLNGAFDGARLRGKIVLIGASALELGDEFSTPVQPTMPGVYVHALAYESLAQGRALVGVNPNVMLGLALLVFWLLWPRQASADMRAVLVRHGLVLLLGLLAPVAAQAIWPVSVDSGLVLLAQALCIVATVQRELAYRGAELSRQREAHLTHIAFHDPETELPNRRALLASLEELLSRRDERKVVAIAVGVDRFVTLRNAIGHAHSNRLMAALAKRLQQEFRIPAHDLSTSILGGVALMQDEGALLAILGAERRDGFQMSVEVEGQSIDVSLRIGAVLSEGLGDTGEAMVGKAMRALYHARERNHRYVVFDAAVIADPKLQLALVSDIGRGIARGDFSLVYQAKADAKDGRVVGAEALLRWSHPVHGAIPPDRFVPTAEKTGAIVELTRWALLRAIEDQAFLRAAGEEIVISVNVSARALTDWAFCTEAIQRIKQSRASLCLEITETAIIEDPPAAIAAIAKFREAGVRISIDDYGAGLSSLGYLKQIEADELKLDKGLISELRTSARDRLILKSTIELAHGLGMSVVSEGVEDEATRALVADMGCDCVQGYLVSRPLPSAEFARLCVEARADERGSHGPDAFIAMKRVSQ